MIIMEMNKKICTGVYALFTAKSSFRPVCYIHKTNDRNRRSLHLYTSCRVRTASCRAASTDKTVTSEGFNIISMAWS
jgi:hypothetical protein